VREKFARDFEKRIEQSLFDRPAERTISEDDPDGATTRITDRI